MPFLFPLRTSVSDKASQSSTPTTPVLEVVVKEPETTIRESDFEGPNKFFSLRRRRKSSTASISKSSISRPTWQASSYSTLPLTPPTTWTPSFDNEPAFESPRQSPLPPPPGTSVELQTLNSGELQSANCTVSRPRRRPVSSVDIPWGQQQYQRIVRRAVSLKSDIPVMDVLEMDESEEESETPQNENIPHAFKASQPEDTAALRNGMTAEPVRTPTSPIVRRNIYKPPQRMWNDGDGEYRAMTVWERIGERRAQRDGI